MRANFFDVLILMIFLLTFVFIFILAVGTLKPMKLNQKRKYSTLLLKLTYLFYLSVYMIFIYFLLFFQRDETINYDTYLHWVRLAVAFVIPNVAIFIRRKISFRTWYNYTFSVINLGATFYILVQLITTPWFIGFK